MDSSYCLDGTSSRRRGGGGASSTELSYSDLDLFSASTGFEGSSNNSFLFKDGMDSSASSRQQRRVDDKLFLANRSTHPSNTQTRFTSSSCSLLAMNDLPQRQGPACLTTNNGSGQLDPVTEQPDENEAEEQDTPQYLVFKRRKSTAMRRSSAWY